MTRFTPFPVLQTERLCLREPTHQDESAVYYLRTDHTVNKFVKRPSPQNMEEARAFIDKVNAGRAKGENVYWSIVVQEEPYKMLGSICLWNFSADGKRGEVGYDLSPEAQGKGYMGEALACVLRYGFEQLKLNAIEAYTQYNNEASVKLLIKHGFKLVQDKKDPDNPYNTVYEILQ